MRIADGFRKIGDDLEKVIEKDDSNSSVTTDSEEGKQNLRTTREKIAHVMHSNKFQIGVIILVIIDCLLVISELLIDLGIVGDHKHSVVPKVLHYMSIGILAVFMVELAVKIYAMGLDFFRHKMEVFDGIVVVVSFGLDVAFANEENIKGSVGLLIILRLWRVTRVLNGKLKECIPRGGYL